MKESQTKIFKKLADLAYENKDNVLPEKQKVNLNYKRITSEKDYFKRQKKYRKFLEENKDKVFTVEYDRNHPDGKLVCLEEDTTEPKWLFTSYDLIPVPPILKKPLTKEEVLRQKIEEEQKKLLLEAGEIFMSTTHPLKGMGL